MEVGDIEEREMKRGRGEGGNMKIETVGGERDSGIHLYMCNIINWLLQWLKTQQHLDLNTCSTINLKDFAVNIL